MSLPYAKRWLIVLRYIWTSGWQKPQQRGCLKRRWKHLSSDRHRPSTHVSPSINRRLEQGGCGRRRPSPDVADSRCNVITMAAFTNDQMRASVCRLPRCNKHFVVISLQKQRNYKFVMWLMRYLIKYLQQDVMFQFSLFVCPLQLIQIGA